MFLQSFRQAVLGAGKGTLDDFETVFHTFFQDFPHFFQDFPHFFQDFPHFFSRFSTLFSRFSTHIKFSTHKSSFPHTNQVFHTQIKFSTHKSSYPHTNEVEQVKTTVPSAVELSSHKPRPNYSVTRVVVFNQSPM